MRIWNAESGEEIGNPLEGDSIACSRDGRFMASIYFGTIRLWGAQTYEKIGEFTGHTYAVGSVCFSFDRKYIASGSVDHSVRVWNVGTRLMVCVLKGHTNGVTSVAIILNCLQPQESPKAGRG